MGGVCPAGAAPPLLTINYESVAEEIGDAALASVRASAAAEAWAHGARAPELRSIVSVPAGSAAGTVCVRGKGGGASANIVAISPEPALVELLDQ